MKVLAIWLILTVYIIPAIFASKDHGHHHSKHTKDPKDQTRTEMNDAGLHYMMVVPFGDEWNRTFSTPNNQWGTPGPVHFWFRCLDNELRSYFIIEGMNYLNHGKEADMAIANTFRERVTLLADGEKINFKVWNGGGDFTVNVANKNVNDHVHISVKGWKHYAIFPLNQCRPSKPKSEKMKLVMNIHTRTFDRVEKINPNLIQGVVNHYAYHKCAIGIDDYELVIQKGQIPFYMKNENFSTAVKSGMIKLVYKNEYEPGPMYMPGTDNNCYWQAITQNLAILQHWKENVRVFFWDTDEYMTFSKDYTYKDFKDTLVNNPITGYDRYMAFCKDCPRRQAEIPYFSFTDRTYKKGDFLQHPKLAVDPSVAGCFIIHWAGCGGKHQPDQKLVPKTQAWISHFENMYNGRWGHSQEEVDKMDPLEYPVLKKCDPAQWNWKHPPSSKRYFTEL